MDGPTTTSKPIIDIDLHSLTFKDMVILKRFIEKGFRANLFVDNETSTAKILLTKLDNIIKEVIERDKSS